MNTVAETGSTIIPTLRYRNALAMIEWLQRAFGFRAMAVYAEGAIVHHAQLSYGAGMIMVGTAGRSGAWNEHCVQPDEIGLRETQACCVIVRDPDAHYAQATAAGATVVIDISDQDYGGRGYACRDPEGHLWWFGSYDPWRDGAN